MAGRGHKPGENVFKFTRRVGDARSLPHERGDDPATPSWPNGQPAELAIALLPAPQLAQEMILQWLRQAAAPCRVTVLDPAHMPSADEGEERYDLVVLCHCLQEDSPEQMLGAIRTVRSKWGSVPLVVVSDIENGRLVVEALRNGVNGYIPTRLPVQVAVAAVKLVLSGGTYSPPLLSNEGLHRAAADDDPLRPPLKPLPEHIAAKLKLSPRECQVLQLMQIGYSNRQIGKQLNISQNTVMVHVRHLMRKLGATNRTQAVFKAGQLIERPRENGNGDT